MASAVLPVVSQPSVSRRMSVSAPPPRNVSPLPEPVQPIVIAEHVVAGGSETTGGSPERRQPSHPDYMRRYMPRRSNSGDSVHIPPPTISVPEPSTSTKEVVVTVQPKATATAQIVKAATPHVRAPSPVRRKEEIENVPDWFKDLQEQIRDLGAVKPPPTAAPEAIETRTLLETPAALAPEVLKLRAPRSRTSILVSKPVTTKNSAPSDAPEVKEKPAKLATTEGPKQAPVSAPLGRGFLPAPVLRQVAAVDVVVEKSSGEESADESVPVGRAIETPPPSFETGIVTNDSPPVKQGRHRIQDSGLIQGRHETPTSVRERHVRRPSLLAERTYPEELLSGVPTNVIDAITAHADFLEVADLDPPSRNQSTPSPIPPTDPPAPFNQPDSVPLPSSHVQREERRARLGAAKPSASSIPMALRRPSMEKVITSNSPIMSASSPAPAMQDARPKEMVAAHGKPKPSATLQPKMEEVEVAPPLAVPLPVVEYSDDSSKYPIAPKDIEVFSPKDLPLPIATETRIRSKSATRDKSSAVPHGILRSAPSHSAEPRAAAQTKQGSGVPTSRTQRAETLPSKSSAPVLPQSVVPPIPPIPATSSKSSSSTTRRVSESSRQAPQVPAATSEAQSHRRQRTNTNPTSSSSRPSRSRGSPPLPNPKEQPPPVPPPPVVQQEQPRSESPASVESEYVEVTATATAVPQKMKGGLFGFFKRNEGLAKLSRSGKSQTSPTPSPTGSTDALEHLPPVHRTSSKTKPLPTPVPVSAPAPLRGAPVPAEGARRHPDRQPTRQHDSSTAASGALRKAQLKEKDKEKDKGTMTSRLFRSKRTPRTVSSASMEAVLGSSVSRFSILLTVLRH